MQGRDTRPLRERYFSKPFPKNTIASPVYLNYTCYQSIPKPRKHRAFFVLRDPRDIVVSWYFYHKNGNYMPTKKGRQVERKVTSLSKQKGLCFAIEYLNEFGLFEMQETWAHVKDANVKIFKYEDLTGPNQFEVGRHLFDHCNIPIPDDKLRALLETHAFERTAKGRAKGEESASSHYRKGKSGDWKEHFDEVVEEKFREVNEGLISTLDY